jgi:hypothetical protein
MRSFSNRRIAIVCSSLSWEFSKILGPNKSGSSIIGWRAKMRPLESKLSRLEVLKEIFLSSNFNAQQDFLPTLKAVPAPQLFL